MTVALYSRVSTLEQKEKGHSLDAQKQQLENYAKAMNYDDFEHFVDGGFTGSNLDRPGIQAIITGIKLGKIDRVIVIKLDRLSRNQRNTLYLIEDVFDKHDVGFISLQESFDTTTSFGRAMIGIISTFAQLERDTITERLLTGRIERAKKGYFRGGNNTPTGYDYKDGHLYPNQHAPVIRDIFNRYIDGEAAYSIYLDLVEKYPDVIYAPVSIPRILDNATYTGKVIFNGETYEGLHEPIIDNETFEMAQTRRNNLPDKYKVDKTKRAALLARKIYCGKCGKSLVRIAYYYKENEAHKGYYQCNGKRKKNYTKLGFKCTQQNLKVNDIDAIILDKLNSLNYDNPKDVVRKEQPISGEVRLKEITNQERRLLDLYQLEHIDVNELNDRLTKLRKEKTSLTQDKQVKNTSKIIDTLESLQDVDIYDLNFQEQCAIVDTLIDKVVAKDDDLKIYLNF